MAKNVSHCSVLQCLAVSCSVVQCGAVWCSVVRCVAAYFGTADDARRLCVHEGGGGRGAITMQRVAVCCGVLQRYSISSPHPNLMGLFSMKRGKQQDQRFRKETENTTF